MQRMHVMLAALLCGSPPELAALLAKEMDKWAKVIKAAGVKLD